MDSDQGKLFIGGISWETNEQKLKDHFSAYGHVSQAVVMRDKLTSKPRGFGFVVFSDPDVLDTVLQDTHVIDGRTVEAKKALSREEQHGSKSGNPNSGRSFSGGGNARTKKIFVGGLPPTINEDGFRNYFETYGSVTDVVIMYDQQTNRPRGFGFISFDSEDAVDRVLHKTFHDLNGKQVEVKRALPKDANPGATGRSGGGGGSYQGYGQSGGNPYDGRMDSNRYMQSQNTSSGYPPYSASGYSNPYGYGPSNGMAFGGYGAYGGASAGYGGPGGGYGNPNVTNAGYGSNQGAAARSSWGSQTASGYGGNMGYGNAPYSAPNASTGLTGRAGGTGHSPSAAGYGNQGYGFGGYGTNDGMYGNQAGYGAVGGRQGSGPNGNSSVGGGAAAGDVQTGGGGYMGGGYGDTSGNAGYGTQGWRSEPSQASSAYGQANYGGGYDGTQAQQQ